MNDQRGICPACTERAIDVELGDGYCLECAADQIADAFARRQFDG